MQAQTTTISFVGGPRDGEEIELANPPEIMRVDGSALAYARVGATEYQWGARVSEVTPAPINPPPFKPTIGRAEASGLRITEWIGLVLMLALVVTFAVFVSNFARSPHRENMAGTITTVAPAPTPMPTPRPTPIPLSPDNQIRTHNERVLRALPVPTPVPLTIIEETPAPRAELVVPRAEQVVMMPFGQKVAVRLLGTLPNQEALPQSGNAIGDTYKIGKDYFVYCGTAGGLSGWIDPVIP